MTWPSVSNRRVSAIESARRVSLTGHGGTALDMYRIGVSRGCKNLSDLAVAATSIAQRGGRFVYSPEVVIASARELNAAEAQVSQFMAQMEALAGNKRLND